MGTESRARRRERKRAALRAELAPMMERELARLGAIPSHDTLGRMENLAFDVRYQEGMAGRPRPKHCEVCGQTGEIFFDHCHKTEFFRGWICRGCNSALGFARDNPATLRALADYLERFVASIGQIPDGRQKPEPAEPVQRVKFKIARRKRGPELRMRAMQR